MVTCRVRRINYEIIKVEQVEKRVAKTLHDFLKGVKRILRTVYDLNRVKIGFSVDQTTALNRFILQVSRLLGFNRENRGIFVVIFDGPSLLYAGVIFV